MIEAGLSNEATDNAPVANNVVLMKFRRCIMIGLLYLWRLAG